MSRHCGSWWDRHYRGVLKRAGGDGGGNAPWWEYWTAQHITLVTQWAVSHDRPLSIPHCRTTDRQRWKCFSEVFCSPLETEREQKVWCTGRAKEKETLVLVKAKQHVREARGPFDKPGFGEHGKQWWWLWNPNGSAYMNMVR